MKKSSIISAAMMMAAMMPSASDVHSPIPDLPEQMKPKFWVNHSRNQDPRETKKRNGRKPRVGVRSKGHHGHKAFLKRQKRRNAR